MKQRSLTPRWALLAVLPLALCLPQLAHAQATSAPVKKTMIVELERTVYVSDYTPPVDVQAVTRQQATNLTPEGRARAHFSAMAKGDIEWWLSGWSEASRKMMEQRYREENRNLADLAANWKGLLTERKVTLQNKMQLAKGGATYTIIRYRLQMQQQDKAAAGDKSYFQGTLVMKSNAGVWELVQDLAADPLLHSANELWDNPGAEVRVRKPAD